MAAKCGCIEKPTLNLCLMSSGYQMISYSLDLPKGNLSFILNLRVNHRHIEFVISGICTSVMSLSYLVLGFWGYLSLCFQLYFQHLDLQHNIQWEIFCLLI